MAEMGLGYGSEYQLLRYLGHHRNELNKAINQNTSLKGELIWIDFPKNLKRISLDGEYTGIDFFNDEVLKSVFNPKIIDNIKNGWKAYWSTIGTQPNWDAIILHKNGEETELVIVEAKAHLEEIVSQTYSASNQKIQNAFKDTQKNLNISNNNWFGKYYQLANRLALVNYIRQHGIHVSLLYVYFLNGYKKRQIQNNINLINDKSVSNIADWEKVINDQYKELGISEISNKYISKIFIDCTK